MTQTSDWGSGSTFDWAGGSVFNWSPDSSAFNVNRLGQSAAATTPPGTPPAYGTAFDLASVQGLTADQFRDYARTIAASAQRPLVDLAARNVPADQHAKELEIAQNFERYQLSMENESFSNTDDDDEGWLSRFGNDLQTGFRMARNRLGQGVHEAGEILGLNDDNAPDYETYVAKGGALTEDEWNSFAPNTRNELFDRANVAHTTMQVADTPGIKQTLWGLDQGYRGIITAGDTLVDTRAALFGDESTGSFWSDATMAFSPSKWAENWRASDDRSIGNMILDNLLVPRVSQDTLDEWRKHNSWYQMSSVGAEFAATWYVDGGVILGKGVGSARRIARNEMPLNEASPMYAAIREAQQGREVISVRTAPAKRWAKWRAERTTEGFNGLIDYAKATKDDFRTFAMLPSFHGRTASGVAAARAIHVAANSGDEKLIDLTRGALNGDLRSLHTIQQMKEDPSRAARFVDGTNFVQAWDAVKLKANQFETEIEKLSKRKVGENLSHFSRWEIDTDIALKERELSEMKSWLDADSDYYEWLASIGTTAQRSQVTDTAVTAVDPYNPQLERYSAPKTKWNDVEKRFDVVTHRRFMPDIFSTHHTHIKVPHSLAARRIGVVSMHDFDSGKRGVERFFNQIQSVLDFDDADGALRRAYDERWAKAATQGTNHDRYKVMYDMEEEILVSALAGKLGVSEATTRAVFDKINDERQRTFEGLTTGKGRAYEAGPTFKQRLEDESGSTARIVSGADENGMMTMEFRDGQRLVTAEVHESMLTPRVRPVDVTQTPNYYQPADVRRLYHEMKRNADVLREIDAMTPVSLTSGVREFARHDKANLMEINEILATKFYSFWKPLQLWRLGWPQRVLMDEGFRAMAIFGPMYWITGPGAESVFTAARNTPAFLRDKYRSGKHGNVVLTDGPLAPKTKATDAFEWAREAEKGVRIAAHDFPKVAPDRLGRLEKMNVEAGKALDFQRRALAYKREWEQAGIRHESIADSSLMRLRQRQTDLHGYSRAMLDLEDYNNFDRRQEILKAFEDHPVQKAMKEAAELRSQNAIDHGALVFDPISGKRTKQGYFVPVPDLGHQIGKEWPVSDNNAMRWVEQNSELLARRGIRIQIDGDEIKVGRWFNNKQRRKAEDFMRSVAESRPVGQQQWKAHNLAKGEDIEILDINDQSEFMQSVNEYFVNEEIKADGPGIIPTTEDIEGKVFHGAYNQLPDELQRREDVIMANGQMMGQGLYTTMNREMAESYGDFVHTIKNTRTGQRVEAFDADQAISADDAEEFFDWVSGKPFAWEVAEGYKSAERTRRALDGDGSSYYNQFFTKAHEGKGQITWANLFEMTGDDDARGLITQYLEEVKGAGAIKHMGGSTHSTPHQVYVWLHPEDLEVGLDVPVGTGKFQNKRMPLLEWMRNSDQFRYAAQSPVPESRIVRFGKRNPMIRDLHQTHAKRVAMEKSDYSHLGTDEYDDLLAHEQSIMLALGLEYQGYGLRKARAATPAEMRDVADYSHLEGGKPNVWGQDWYEIRDKDAFNRMMESAYHTNGALDWAKAANGDLRRTEVDELLNSRDFSLEEFDLHLDNVGSRIADAMKREFGSGRTAYSSNGRIYHVDNVFEGNRGRLTRALTSSAPAMDTLTDAHTSALGLMRHQSAGHVRIHAPQMTPETLKVGTPQNKKAILYFQRWADLMNNQVANSPVWGPMLKGARDEDVVKFLREDPKGHKHRMEVLEPHESVEAYVNEMRAKLDYYLPSNELRRRLAKGPIQPSDLRRKVHNDDLPDIYGPDLTLEDKHFLRRIADNIWNALGTIPADKFSRQPFAKAVYNQKIRSLLNQSEAKFLDERALERIQTMAAEHTREQVRQHLFDLTDGTNLTDALRFVAPFWGAQEEAMLKWAKIISDRPETVARFFNGQRAIYNNMIVVDENGQPVEQNRPGNSALGFGIGYHPTDQIVMQIPDVVRKGPLGKALENIGSIGIPIGSANTVLQGENPILPSFGPWMTIPADKLLRAMSDTHFTEKNEEWWYRWLFPIGRPGGGAKGIMEQLVPGWGRRVMGATAEDDSAYFNLYMQMAREMTLRNKEKGLPEPTPEEVESAANLLWGARTLASFAAPVQMSFRPQNQFWSDEAHRYKKEYGADWETKFYEDFGEEAMIYAVSSSHSLAGVPPTSAGISGWDAHKKLVAEHPEFGGLIVGSDSYLDEFNYDAYKMQFEANLGPGDSRTLREITDPRQREANAEESIGWLKFRQIDSTVNAELFARGLTNIQQKGAEDIARYRTEEISRLQREYPAWALAWNTSERTIYQKVEELKDIATRPEFDNRVDIQGLRNYLAIRAQVAEQLDLGYANGYSSRNLQAQENFALRNWFYEQVGTLIQNNPAFGEVYSRYLSQDTLMQGSGGYAG